MTSRRLHVAVVGGGRSSEHDVSLASAASVGAALRTRSHRVTALTVGRDGVWSGDSGRLGDSVSGSLAGAVRTLGSCDVVLPAMHGPHGEDGTLAALCELAGVPYVGSGVRGGALGMDKWVTKLVAEELGIRTAACAVLTAGTAGRATYETPVVVKPVSAGSSNGVSLVRHAADLEPAIAAALALDDRVLVEELLVGREIDVAVLERPDRTRVVGPALEIVVPLGTLFDSTVKYDGSADFRLPALVSDVEAKGLADAALALFDALGCSGVARFDFFLTDRGLVLNEVNTMPGMTAASQVPRMFATAGLPYAELLDELVQAAVAVPRTR